MGIQLHAIAPYLSILGVVADPRFNHLIWIQSTTQKLLWKQPKIHNERPYFKIHNLYNCVKERESEEHFFFKSFLTTWVWVSRFREEPFYATHTSLFVSCAERGQLLTLELVSRDRWLSPLHLLPRYAPKILDAAVGKIFFYFHKGTK